MRTISVRPDPAIITIALFCTLVALNPLMAQTQTTPTPDPLHSLQFLVGKWNGVGKSDAGAIQGTGTFQKELQGHVLVRRDISTFPNQGTHGKPYEQMMMITPDASGNGSFHAGYWDSVGHVIEYVGTAKQISGTDQVQFLSALSVDAPRFRLTYTAVSPSRLHIVFEMEPPGGSVWHTIADGYSVKTGI